ncbi:MAG: carbamoyl-phosphate synthase large subunit [Bdellovibrionales bacterium]|nr:carbamoyl-phosphate synthase large subunit [Bdellovibrionales bacterium]
MAKRTDIKKILLIGSGPITIGQACEFDYSGTQAIRALREDGYQVVLVNSNPATIMTDPELSDKVYIEPLTVPVIEEIIKQEKPDAILPTMGGQTALNLTLELHRAGVLKKYNVEILGAKPDVIHRAEDREAFKACMDSIGVESAKSRVATNLDEGKKIMKDFGLPLILRPSFTLGGEGGGVCHTEAEFIEKLQRALFLSPNSSCLIEESLLGWKEFELEVVRDKKDNVVIVCSIENLDPMGVHTGDSITVAPAQTLTDKEYQNLRNQSIRIIRAIGVETGGSNIQFAVNPTNGRVIVIEMNPRVSRSSALASKATGFPIARIAAKLAVGYTLDELKNDITGTTPASFEPSIDYVVTKIPRFDFEKFKETKPELGTQMKSVGEVMALGRSFQESFMKAVSSLEMSRNWLQPMPENRIYWERIENPHPERIWSVADAMRKGATVAEISKRSAIDPWFLDQIAGIIAVERRIVDTQWPFTQEFFREIKRIGFSDFAIGKLKGIKTRDVRMAREGFSIFPTYHSVDTCAGEFEARTPFWYSSYQGTKNESIATTNPNKVMIIGSGPNRIGQGIEFDYSCVHAAMALREMNYETIMVNCNPETVSTDYDMSDRLYFEPLSTERMFNIARLEKPMGAIVQLGGQTPLKIAKLLEAGELKILGTSPESIDLAEDRKRFDLLVREILPYRLKQPAAAIAHTKDEAIAAVNKLGFPVLLRPSYVLGGRGMRIIRSMDSFMQYIDEAILVSEQHPVLIDRFLDRAIEVDVDALSDGEQTLIAGIMEHIEEAGVHSGDSASCLPPHSLPRNIVDRIRTYTRILGRKLNVRGLMNAQFAIQGDDIYLIEVNPRASRSAPFVSKAVGTPIIKIATAIMVGKTLKELGYTMDFDQGLTTYNVKAPVFPFHKFPGVDPVLGPEMKSTGEVMGRSKNFAMAYHKALEAAGVKLPRKGKIFISVRNEDKAEALSIAEQFINIGFTIVATGGTYKFMSENGLACERVNKVSEGGPHCVDGIRSGSYGLIINIASDDNAVQKDGYQIRRAALERKIPYSTVLSSAWAMLVAIEKDLKTAVPELTPLTNEFR